MKLKPIGTLILAILIPLAVGMISALFTTPGMAAYSQLIKPPLTPPSAVFPVVWTILYVLMGISSYLIYRSGSEDSKSALGWYAVQLLLNFLWSILFFGMSQYLPAFFLLLLLISVLIRMISSFYQISPLAAYLQIPYLLWCLFAAYLNLSIYLLNR